MSLLSFADYDTSKLHPVYISPPIFIPDDVVACNYDVQKTIYQYVSITILNIKVNIEQKW